MYLAKKDDDPDRVRPPQRGNDERRIGQGKKEKKDLHLYFSGFDLGKKILSFPHLLRLCAWIRLLSLKQEAVFIFLACQLFFRDHPWCHANLKIFWQPLYHAKITVVLRPSYRVSQKWQPPPPNCKTSFIQNQKFKKSLI